ncbi:MAG: NADH-quinone oxidoreductase subunit N [bacterium]
MALLQQILEGHPSYAFLFPELFLIGAGLLMIFFDLFIRDSRKNLVACLGMASLLFTAVAVIFPADYDLQLVTGMIKNMMVNDGYAVFFKIILLCGSFLIMLVSLRYVRLTKYIGEYYALIVLCTAGFMLLASAVNLLMVYLCIEYIGICCYILCCYLKDDPKSSEGAIKYLLLGATASAFLVYGISLLYGLTGSLHIGDIGAAIRIDKAIDSKIILVAFLFVITGFGFKIAMAPFHMWAPDAYEGAPTSITAFFSVLPKAAGLAVLVRVLMTVFQGLPVEWVHIVETLAILTMTIGNVVAIWQTNIKRMLAYSSIAHVGYILIGLVVAGALGIDSEIGADGIFAILVYITAYLFMNIGAFAVVIVVSNKLESDFIERYAGLGRRAPFMAIALTFFFLSLAGIPPTAGFIGKFFIFKAAIAGEFYLLAIAGIINSVISVYYYWNVVRYMFIEEPLERTPLRAASPLWVTVVVAVLAVLAMGIFFQPLIDLASSANLQYPIVY